VCNVDESTSVSFKGFVELTFMIPKNQCFVGLPTKEK
jgi:hypothetical protein